VICFKKTSILVLILLLIVLRFSFILKSPLYLDEGIYSLQDGKTPLFFWMIYVFGPLINNYLLAGRLISIFAGLVTAGCWMIIFFNYFNLRKSIIYLFLFLIAPYGFLVERMALSDSLLMAFASLSLMFLMLFKKILDEKNKRNLLIDELNQPKKYKYLHLNIKVILI